MLSAEKAAEIPKPRILKERPQAELDNKIEQPIAVSLLFKADYLKLKFGL